MANEIARKLTGLPHFTAYAKLLASWKGKIKTLPLGELHKPVGMKSIMSLPRPVYLSSGPVIIDGQILCVPHETIGECYYLTKEFSRRFLKLRTEIEEEIRERHDRLVGGCDEEPLSGSIGRTQEPVPVRYAWGDILPAFSRQHGRSEDEPPPSRS